MQFLRTLAASIIGTLAAIGILFLIGMALLIGIASTADRAPNIPDASVLKITLSGSIPERITPDPFQQLLSGAGGVDLRAFKRALRYAAEDERIETLWLRTEGVTAQWATLQEMRRALMEFKESGKEIVAFAGASGFNEQSYFLASTADRIYAPPETSFELDGFATVVTFYANLLDKLEIDPVVVRVGKYKSAVEPYTRTNLSPASEEQLSALLQTQNAAFMTTLSEAVDIPVDRLQYLASEDAVYTAETAYEVGLIDSLLYEDQVRELLKELSEQEEDEDLQSVSLSEYVRATVGDLEADDGPSEIAIVYAQGTITGGESRRPPGPFAPSILGADTFVEAMHTATEDEDVAAIVIRINSPGGGVSASNIMWHAVVEATQEKPVIVSMGDVAASGGYYIAAPADTIVADPLTITGSIGVFGLFFDVSGLFEEELGITFDAVKTSPFADAFSGLRDFRPEERQKYQRIIQEIYREFVQKVAAGRPLSVEEVREVAQGRVWSGLQAEEIGLVDVLGGLEDAIDIAAERAGLEEGEYGIQILPRPEPFAQQLVEALQVRAWSWWKSWIMAPLDRSLLQHVETLHRLESLYGSPQMRLPFEISIN